MKVKIITPCRLHFGLIDLNGCIGRIDGGLGVALNEPNVIIEVETANNGNFNLEVINSQGYSSQELRDLTLNIIDKLKLKENLSIQIESNIPAHIGLGSKTQLSLSISKALCMLNGIEKTPSELARITSRAGTSRIGLTAFERGGFTVDGGHTFGSGKQKEAYLPSSASIAPPAPVIFWSPIPADWFFVVIIPQITQGAHGSTEIDIFKQNCPISLEEIRIISHIILMKILPAMRLKNIDVFGQGVHELQGLGFKKLEIELQKDIVSELIAFCMENGAAGSGMSSFGPTTFAIVEGFTNAQKLKRKIENFLKDQYEAKIFITNVNNEGSITEIG